MIVSRKVQDRIDAGDWKGAYALLPAPKARKRIARKSWLKNGKTMLPKVNLARAKRRLAEYKAYMASPEWKAIRKAAMQRAGFRCEELTPTRTPGAISVTRCPMTTTLTVHHKSYVRFGGREIPKDLQCLCKAHHDAVEKLKGGRRLWQRAG